VCEKVKAFPMERLVGWSVGWLAGLECSLQDAHKQLSRHGGVNVVVVHVVTVY
jgi:hypothetical protein